MSFDIAQLPLQLGKLDHYTLIVEDAAATARFHSQILGFEQLKIQMVNAGTVPDGEHDMLNHIMRIPGTANRVMVITEGLTEESIFRRYLPEYGPGVQHVAYEIDDIEAALRGLHDADIQTTSREVQHDPLTGLRQLFINREYPGYFIELIERTEQSKGGTFTNQNMAGLAKTMLSYLADTAAAGPTGSADPSVALEVAPEAVIEHLLDPFNLPAWTGHRTIRRIGGQLVEVRMHGDVPLAVTREGEDVCIVWELDSARLEVRLSVSAAGDGSRIDVALPELPQARLDRTRRIIQAELDVLAAQLHGRPETVSEDKLRLIDDYHLEIYQRKGL
jgi:catechol 2,3-dioxygenase-like lactoylglutathione lyase family enzyme